MADGFLHDADDDDVPPAPLLMDRFSGDHVHDIFCMLRQFNISKRRGRSQTETPMNGAMATRYSLGFDPTRHNTNKQIIFVREGESATAEGASQESIAP